LNNQINQLAISDETSVARNIQKLKEILKDKQYSRIAQNPVIQNLIAEDTGAPAETKIVKIFNKGNDLFNQNILISAMAELKEATVTKDLYEDIVRIGFIQSGISISPISFTDVIPIEDFKKYLLPALNSLENKELLNGFLQNDAFYKNSWKDTALVPKISQKFGVDSETGEKYVKNKFVDFKLDSLAISKGISDFQAWKISTRSKNYSSRFVTINLNKKTYLLKRLEDSQGEPVTKPYSPFYPSNRYGIYYVVNALGDGYKGQEYYDYIRQSAYENNTYKPEYELSNEEIISVLEGNNTENNLSSQKTENQTVQGKINNCLS
jgi:hypothetical protein